MYETLKALLKEISTHWTEIITVLGFLGIAVDITPTIKVQPIRLFLKWIGAQMNKSIQMDVDEIKQEQKKLSKEFENHTLESKRHEILEFATQCINNQKHDKEQFDHILSVYNDYEEYIRSHHLTNGQVDVAYEYIHSLYLEHCKNHDFNTAIVNENTPITNNHENCKPESCFYDND